MSTKFITLLFLGSSLAAGDLIGIPTVPFQESGDYLDLSSLRNIVVDKDHCEATDTNGHTLIPPTLLDFANTFASDLQDTGCHAKASAAGQANDGDIYITIGNSSEFVDAAGRWTSEAYSLNVSGSGITIVGASPLGAWWATRTLLQQAALHNGSVPTGYGIDSPGWGTRGIMLDCARHYYPPEFIIELCTWQSYWKNNIFQFHLSDNLYNNPNYTREQELDLYARFRLLSDDHRVAGLNKHENESYTREDFDSIQYACAARGVTVIPEIESPGHALVISQWKPELGLEGTLDLLNVTYSETIPTVKAIWDVFAPWFKSKVFHIGADEYSDDSLSEYETGEAYNFFVKSMNDYIRSTFDRSMRIWGTFPPQSNYTDNVDTDVTIQHWEFFEDNPYHDYILNNYSVVNSDDRVYIVTKYSTSYPQQLNETFIFHGNPDGGAWSPYIFDSTNSSNNPERNNPYVIGHIAPQWNDYGANTSTYLEAYYAWRSGLPALADKQWGGNLSQAEHGIIFDRLQASAPAQNLDRTVKSKSATILHYNFSSATSGTREIADQSGNEYNGKTDCAISSSALQIRSGCSLTTPLESKGEDYTLSFSVKPSSGACGPIFTGKDSILQSSNSSLDLVSGGYAFALNYSLPIGEWTQAKLIRSGNKTFFAANDQPEMEFLTRIGVNGERFQWSAMAINAPVHSVGGGEWEGEIGEMKLLDHVS